MLRYDAAITRWSTSADASCPREGFVPNGHVTQQMLAERIPAKRLPGRQT